MNDGRDDRRSMEPGDPLPPVSIAFGPGDDDDDDDESTGGGSGGNIDPDDDEGYGDDDDDDEDEEPLQVSPNDARCTAQNRAIMIYMRRPASFDGCPPHASPDPGNRIIGF